MAITVQDTVFKIQFWRMVIRNWVIVLGLSGKVLVARKTTGMISVRRHQELPICHTEPVEASSKTTG